ncbi:VIT1/CCC1 family predicted Fe2+/Mn2+ transporter [Desulfoprunum benzoelyticum]|uniref:VIT1/CCC1 family predicted Fe2+/Mn2+ transporter n=1 Tax=Desulfoprunum benzoelyticum TaxID=1506996 RepID=A0A840UW08_9BACT|nr:VIT1/CCC1 family predicted Fe2+/Mn2+ transporter [Desulfoprunum benzoelyticum]
MTPEEHLTQHMTPEKVFKMRQAEQYRTQCIGWLRAAVLGANDGIVSAASLIEKLELSLFSFSRSPHTSCI